MEMTLSVFLWGMSSGQTLCWGKGIQKIFMTQFLSLRTSELGWLNQQTNQLANIEGKTWCYALASNMEIFVEQRWHLKIAIIKALLKNVVLEVDLK